MLLTSVLKKYATKECSPKYSEVIQILAGALECEPGEVTTRLDELLSVVLEKKPMHTYGATPDDVPAFAESVLTYQQVIMSHNPTELSMEDIMDIYNDCL